MIMIRRWRGRAGGRGGILAACRAAPRRLIFRSAAALALQSTVSQRQAVRAARLPRPAADQNRTNHEHPRCPQARDGPVQDPAVHARPRLPLRPQQGCHGAQDRAEDFRPGQSWSRKYNFIIKSPYFCMFL